MVRYRIHAVCLLALALAALPVGSARAAEVDRYIPRDAEVVVSVNVKQILDSALVQKQGLAQLQGLIQGSDVTKATLAKLGFDPLKDVDQLIIATPGGKADDRGLVIVHGRFDKTKFDAMAAQAAQDHGDIVTIHKSVSDPLGGKHTIYELNVPNLDRAIFVGIVDKGPMLVSAGKTGKDYLLEGLARSSVVVDGGLKNKELQGLIEKADAKQSVTIIALGSALAKNAPGNAGKAKELLEKLDSLNAGLMIANDVKLEVVLAAKTPDGAKEVHEAVKAGLNQGLGFVAMLADGQKELAPLVEVMKSVKTAVTDKTVTVKGEVSAELIQQSIKQEQKKD